MNKMLISVCMLTGISAFAQQQDSLNSTKIEEVIIKAILKKDSEYTNKMPLKAIENPQAYSTVDRIFFDNQMIYSVDEAYRNVTGIQKMWSATNRAGDGGAYIALRGFASNNSLRNGLVAPVTTVIDAVNVEKLEVLKGPSATLYGSNVTSYGGAVNRVTKKPYDHFGGNISVVAGSYNYYRAQADINTPVTKDKKLMFRVNTAYTNTGMFQKPDAKNTYLAFVPSLLYKANDKLSVGLEYETFSTRAAPGQAYFYLSKATTGVDNMKDLENMGLNYKESYFGDGLYTEGKVHNIFGTIDYKINDNIKSSTNVSTSNTLSDGYNPYFSARLNPQDNKLYVVRADQTTNNSKSRILQIQQNFNFDYKFGANMRNRTVVGFDYMRMNNRFRYKYLQQGFFDVVPANGYDYASTFNSTTLSQAYQNMPISTYEQIDDRSVYSGYISNVFTPLEGLNILAAIRYENNDFEGGTLWTQPIKPYKQSAFSPKFGVVYEIVKDQFSVFGNYQNSFKSNGYYTADMAGNSVLSDPEKANQFEAGFRANLFNGRVNSTLSFYNIKVNNSLVTVGYSGATPIKSQAGELLSKGVELEVNAYLWRGLSLVGGVSYNDSEYIKSSPITEGRRPGTAGSPWLASLYASYQILDGTMKGFGFGLGGNYASDQNERNNNLLDANGAVIGDDIFVLPEYLVLNASVFYDTEKYRIGLKVDNFTNQHYWVGYTTANPQQLINALGTFTYKF